VELPTWVGDARQGPRRPAGRQAPRRRLLASCRRLLPGRHPLPPRLPRLPAVRARWRAGGGWPRRERVAQRRGRGARRGARCARPRRRPPRAVLRSGGGADSEIHRRRCRPGEVRGWRRPAAAGPTRRAPRSALLIWRQREAEHERRRP
jgi:hypothetical protein